MPTPSYRLSTISFIVKNLVKHPLNYFFFVYALFCEVFSEGSMTVFATLQDLLGSSVKQHATGKG